MTVLMCLVLALLGILTAGAAIAGVFVKRRYDDFVNFVSPPAEGKASPFGVLLAGFTHQVADDLMTHAKTSLMGKRSVEARQEQAVMGDLIQDSMASSNPMIGAALAAFPQLGKRLGKNPQLAAALMQVLASRGSGNNGNNPQAQGIDKAYQIQS